MKLVWLTDLHFETTGLVAGHDPRMRLDAAAEFVSAYLSDADLCLITGDIVETATTGNYAEVANRLAQLPVPVCVVPGNHDDRSLLLQAFAMPGQVMPGFAQYAVERDGAVLMCLDTLVPGKDHGFLCQERLGWVADRLAEARGRPLIVALHHPPAAIGIPVLDADNLRNGAALLDLLSRHDGPVQVLAGHVHRSASVVAGGIPVRTQRAVLYQAPAPVPAWDWDSFAPPQEAPGLGLVTAQQGQITVHDLTFCSYDHGGAVKDPG